MAAAPSPRFIGIGGSLSALVTGLTGFSRELPWFLLIPPVLIITLPAALLLPGVYALFMYSAAGRFRRDSTLSCCSFCRFFRSQLKTHVAALLLTELLYLVFLYLLVTAVLTLQQQALDTYLAAAAAHQVVQVGTPEQLNYARTVLLTLQGSGAVYLLGFAFLLCFFAARAQSQYEESPLSAAFRAFFKNLPSFLTLVLLALIAFSMIEQSFAALKVEHLRSLWAGGSSNTWYLYFYMLLRLYVCHALLTAFMAAAGGACGIFSLQLHRGEEHDAGA